MQTLPRSLPRYQHYTHNLSHMFNPWNLGQPHNFQYDNVAQADDEFTVRSHYTCLFRVIAFLYIKKREGCSYISFNPSQLFCMPEPDLRQVDRDMLVHTLGFLDALNVVSRMEVNHYHAWLGTPLVESLYTQFAVPLTYVVLMQWPPAEYQQRQAVVLNTAAPLVSPVPRQLPTKKQSKQARRRKATLRPAVPKMETPPVSDDLPTGSPPPLHRQASLYPSFSEEDGLWSDDFEGRTESMVNELCGGKSEV